MQKKTLIKHKKFVSHVSIQLTPPPHSVTNCVTALDWEDGFEKFSKKVVAGGGYATTFSQLFLESLTQSQTITRSVKLGGGMSKPNFKQTIMFFYSFTTCWVLSLILWVNRSVTTIIVNIHRHILLDLITLLLDS